MRGASVAVLDLDAETGAGGGQTESASGRSASVPTSPMRGAMLAAVAETVERFGGLDIAVANAGIAPEGGTARTMPPEEWERVVDVDLMGVWHTGPGGAAADLGAPGTTGADRLGLPPS